MELLALIMEHLNPPTTVLKQLTILHNLPTTHPRLPPSRRSRTSTTTTTTKAPQTSSGRTTR